MKRRLANLPTPHSGVEDETRSFIFMLGVSALCHFLLLGMFYVVPSAFERPFRAGPRAINVDLVSLPAPGTPQPAAKAPAPTPPPKPEPPSAKPEPVPPPPPPEVKKEQVSIAPPQKKPKVVKSLKKKTIPKKTTAVKVTRPAPKEKKPRRAETVSSAIEAMKKTVAGQEQARAAAGAQGTGTGGGVMDRIRNYQYDVGLSVGQNFAFPQQLARSAQGIATLITFRVLPSGEITDVEIYESSGNKQLDEAAYRAVLKSNPVKPHPEGITRPYIEVGLRCTPSGVQ
ncbi:MAG: TonB family protein [Desulfobacterales bacterium]|nr:TonB family protein [Desulfobacterales bacterium]